MASTINAKSTGVGGIDAVGDASGVLALQTGGTTAVTIGTNQNVGIGTSSPNQKLQIQNAATTSGAIQITNNSTGTTSTDGVLFGFDGSNDVIINNQEATATKFYTSGSERMQIDASGNVGIGGASAGDKLQVKGNGASISIVSPTTATNPYLVLSNSADGTANYFYANGHELRISQADASSSSIMTFYTQNIERMRIDSSGNILLGNGITASPTYGKLTVAGGITTNEDVNSKVQFGRYSVASPASYIKPSPNSTGIIMTNAADSADVFAINNSGVVTLLAAGGYIQNSSGRKVLGQSGSVLQVVNAAYGTQLTTSAGAFVDTGLTATITPSSTSSKILVLVNQAAVFVNAVNSAFGTFGIYRNGSGICQFGYIVGYASSTFNRGGAASASYLDSPATTSAVTYKTQVYVANGGTIDCQRDSAGTSTITLIEIAG